MMTKVYRKGKTSVSPLSGYEIEPHMDTYDFNDRIDRPKCTMFGRPCQQAYTAFFLWEKLLSTLEFKRFVEVGTGFGNTSVFFMLHCIQKGAMFITHERMANRSSNSSPLKEWLDLKECCVVGDVYGPSISQPLMELLGMPGRSVLFLDGGDKPYEFKLFVPALKVGDVLAVHDWGRCIKPDWVQDVIDHRALEPIMEAEHAELETMTRMWTVTK